MLHKSFKPAKCKTSLKFATSRIKLMKNKKGVQMNQMKRELAQLLESGQDRTARIRVEHLIREEKMVAAYDLIEIYCELIAARLPIIESQKNCPIDLKEAITSVIFASPRCADIPELLDVKKHFTVKYGKEFITSALELRPNCGVGRMLVEKLSANAPDGQTKVKVLNAIAEEHNIKWDSKSFEEKDSKPADDLLNGPSTFEKASELHAETPKIQVPNVQATSSHDMHVRPSNFTEENARSSLNNQKFSSTEPGGIKTTTTTNHPGFRSSGKGDERMKVGHSFSGHDDAFSSGRQNWNMEFKDATAAAQAAAESAERASMAARAAAELSSRGHINGQYSSESLKSINDSIRHERPGTSKFPGEHFASVPINSSLYDRNSKLQNEQIGSDEHRNLAGDGEWFGDDHGNTKRSSHSASVRSRKASVDDDTFVNSAQKPDGYSEKSSFRETIKADKEPLYSRLDMKKQSVDPRVENVSRWQDDFKSGNVDQFGKARIEKQHSTSSSRSHSSTNSDDYNISSNYHQKFGNDASEDPIVGNDQESIHIDTAKMGSYDDSVAYDEYDYDYIGPKYDEGESSLGRNSPTSPTTTVDTWNPRRNTIKSPEKSASQPHFSAEHHSLFSDSLANSGDPSESDNVSVIPYESDGPKFDSEDEQEKTSHGGIIDSSIFSHRQNIFSSDPEPAQDENYGLTGFSFEKRNSGSDKRSRFGSSSSDDLDDVEVHLRSDQVTTLNVESPKKFDSGESLANYLSPRFSKSQLELNDIVSKSTIAVDEWNVRESSRLSFAHVDNDNVYSIGSRDTLKDELLDQSSTEGENKLSFGTLRGGFRNKGYRHPPYNRKPSGDDASSLTQKAAVESSTLIEQQVASPSARSSIHSSMSNNADKNSGFSKSMAPLDSDSDSDSDADKLVEEVSQKTSSRRQVPYAQKSSKGLNMKSSFRPPVATYFDLDNENDDTKEDIPKQTLPFKGQLGSGFSRRTKASHRSTVTSSNS